MNDIERMTYTEDLLDQHARKFLSGGGCRCDAVVETLLAGDPATAASLTALWLRRQLTQTFPELNAEAQQALLWLAHALVEQVGGPRDNSEALQSMAWDEIVTRTQRMRSARRRAAA